MDPAEIEELTAQILRIERVDQELADAVLEEFYDQSVVGPGVGGGLGMAQQLLESALGAEQAAIVMERLQN